MKNLFSVLWFLCMAFGGSAGHAQTQIIYPAPESVNDVRYNDLIEILNTALEKTRDKSGPYTTAPSAHIMNEARQQKTIEDGTGIINIFWSSTSEDKEKRLLPVRIPLRKGLLGYRIALISKDKQALIDKVHTLDDLRKVRVGQGFGWGDVEIYKANGIPVLTAQYDKIFHITAKGRFDLFPRGIAEVVSEYEANSPSLPDLAIENGLLIYYPWPYYFFFNRNDKALAERIEAGLRTMIKDGSFEAIFYKYNKAAIERANLKNRRIIRLENHLLPKATPLDEKGLWFDPTQN